MKHQPLNFSADLMEASKNGLTRIVTAVDNLKHWENATSAEAIDVYKRQMVYCSHQVRVQMLVELLHLHWRCHRTANV